ncbi:MAG: FAD-linked oxidase C-terminal domain-containing protein [Myxococcales bacterium]|nr:FAD-binding protein [Myxococcales bacterium]HIK83563.1 FAD-binding protein [Myxococcales bacterium]
MSVAPEALIDRLIEIVGSENCLAREGELFVYECDGLTLDPQRPIAVLLPATTNEVAEIVRACREFDIAFVPRGAGTGLSGGAHATENSVLIECSRMNRIFEIDAEDRFAVVGPGVVNAELSTAVADLGLFYAPDPSSQQACTIGGNVAENSGGPHTLKYGTTTNHILALEMVLPDGRIVRFGNRVGEASGFDLVGAIVGSEGTLGIVTEVTVRLTRIPEAVETLLAIFDDVVSACRAVGRIIRSGLVPAALEIVDRRTIEAVEASVYAAGLPTTAGAVLIIELDGDPVCMDEEMRSIRESCDAEGCQTIERARDDAERKRFWRARKGAFGAMGRLAPDLYVHDAVVPRVHLPAILEKVGEICDRHRLKLANVFHAGDGNLHPNICFDRRDADELARVIRAGEEILEACVAVGGVISGEHGIGVEKRDYLHLVFGEADLEPMYRLREAFNPDGVCNPGKIIPTTRFCVESNPKARGYDAVPIE